MSASMLVRQRARRRREAFGYARDYLFTSRLPRGVPAIIDAWVDDLTDEQVQWGPSSRSLAALLQPYKKPWHGA